MLSKIKDAIKWLKGLRETIVEYVMQAERELEGKTGPEKRQHVVDKLDDMIKLPWWVDTLFNLDGLVIGYFVDRVCDALNIFTDGDFSDVEIDPHIVALAAMAPDKAIMKAAGGVAPQATKQLTVNERINLFYEQYGIKAEKKEAERAEAPDEILEPIPEEAGGDVDEKWNRCIAIVGVAEGGANFDVVAGGLVLKKSAQNDPGGPTKYGVTQATLTSAYARGVVGHNDIVRITKDEAKTIFRVMYCDPYGWLELDFEPCLMLLDATINHGLGGTARISQRACNAFGGSPELAVDGKWGPKTKAAVWEVARKDPKEFARMFLRWRKDYFDRIIAANPSQDCFRKGWYNRLKMLAKEAGVASPV